jgi:hypothetical protein
LTCQQGEVAPKLSLANVFSLANMSASLAAMRVYLAMDGCTVERELAKMEETRDPRA